MKFHLEIENVKNSTTTTNTQYFASLHDSNNRLEWSPVHKSAKFWRENALRLNEKNYDLLRTLIHFLEVSKDPLVLAVASYDIGEYVRHNPRGKQ